MFNKFLFWMIFLNSVLIVLCLQRDYYWRDYTGIVPEDAIVGGQDINGKDIFIGQAYTKNGLIVSQIFPNIKEVYVPINGVYVAKSYIKILCAKHENVYWFPTNSTHLHVQMIGKIPVIGGHESTSLLYIGRINYQGEIKIGKIFAANIQNANLRFVHNGKEPSSMLYEVLVYKNNIVDATINK